jgi:hypothetical protein
MVSVLECDRSWVRAPIGSNQDYIIGICCFSAKHAALRRKNKDRLARNRIMCPSVATCLFGGTVCFSELAL